MGMGKSQLSWAGMCMELRLLKGDLYEPWQPNLNLCLQACMNKQKWVEHVFIIPKSNAVFVLYVKKSGSQPHALYCNVFSFFFFFVLFFHNFRSTSPHQWDILKASLLLKDPAEGGTCDNKGDPVRKWLFKSAHQLTCLPNEESCCYWWQQNYFGVISGREFCRSKLIDQKHLIFTELTLATCRSLTRWTKKIRKLLLDKPLLMLLTTKYVKMYFDGRRLTLLDYVISKFLNFIRLAAKSINIPGFLCFILFPYCQC